MTSVRRVFDLCISCRFCGGSIVAFRGSMTGGLVRAGTFARGIDGDMTLRRGPTERRLPRGDTSVSLRRCPGSPALPRRGTMINIVEASSVEKKNDDEDSSFFSSVSDEDMRRGKCMTCEELQKKIGALEEALSNQNLTLMKQRCEIAALKEQLEVKSSKSSWFNSGSSRSKDGEQSKTALRQEIDLLKQTNAHILEEYVELKQKAFSKSHTQ